MPAAAPGVCAEFHTDAACLLGRPQSSPLPPLAPEAAEDIKPYEQMFVAVTVNGKSITQFADVLRSRSGQFLVTPDIFHDAHLLQPSASTVVQDGKAYYAVETLPGAHCRFDEDLQILHVQARPENFEATTIDGNPHQFYPPTPPSSGLFLNHDISFVHTAREQQTSGQFQSVFFHPLGVLTSNLLSLNLLSGATLRRLDTNFAREMPGRRRVLTVGDTLSAGNSWAQSVHYAGVQFASNFAIQPSFLPYSLPALGGQAAEPSTVDIYMNNVLSMRQSVDTGPFTIQNIPVLTQQGDMQMVITDLAGHQQIITRSYIATTQLLRRGVSSYTYEGGILRWGEGSASDHYGTLFAEGTHHYGWRSNVTLDFRGEALASSQALGAGALVGLKHLGMVAGNLAVSHSTAGTGALAYALFTHQSRMWTLAGTAQMATSAFRQLGLLPGQMAPRFQAQAQVSRSIGHWATVSAGYLVRECQGTVNCNPQLRNVSATTGGLGLRLWKRGSLSLSTNYSPAIQKGTAIGVTLSIPLQQRSNVMLSSELSPAGKSGMVDYQQAAPAGDGFGYRARYNTTNTDLAGAVTNNNHYGTYSLAAERSGASTEWSTEERSSLVLVGKQIKPTRWVDSSFAMVDVPGQSGVRVYANNQFITRTDRQGIAIVPLVPFDRNVVRLDDKDVPVQFAMDLSERKVAPYSRTGVRVRFSAEETKGATLILQASDGTPLPLGAQVAVPGGKEEYMVAYDGEVYIPDLVTPVTLHVRAGKFDCDVNVPQSPAGVSLPRLGPLVCKAK